MTVEKTVRMARNVQGAKYAHYYHDYSFVLAANRSVHGDQRGSIAQAEPGSCMPRCLQVRVERVWLPSSEDSESSLVASGGRRAY